MAKLFGKLARLALVAGAAAAAVSYYRQYTEFHRDLDEEFHDYEEGEEGAHTAHTETPNRNYVSLNANRGEFTAAAQNTFEAAKGMVTSAAGMLKDVGNILADNLQAARGSGKRGGKGGRARGGCLRESSRKELCGGRQRGKARNRDHRRAVIRSVVQMKEQREKNLLLPLLFLIAPSHVFRTFRFTLLPD